MASITDVARKARVSIATVSRVINGTHHPVSEETRERVLRVARELGYTPSALAQAMITRESHIVGVIVGDATDPYFASIVRGVEDVAREHGYLVIVCNSDRQPEIEIKYVSTLNDYRVDGVIFAGGGLTDEDYLGTMSARLDSFRARGAAIVTMGRHNFPSLAVEIDNQRVVHEAAEYLIGLGHRSIAYVTGPEHLTTTELRFNGYSDALEAHQIALDPSLVLPGSYTYESGIEAARLFAALPDKPTAVLASSDMMAIGCMFGLKEAGFRIPEDVSLMGIDGITPAQFVDPPLTTITLPLYRQGAMGMEYLVRLRDGGASPTEVVMLDHQLTVRTSTSPPSR